MQFNSSRRQNEAGKNIRKYKKSEQAWKKWAQDGWQKKRKKNRPRSITSPLSLIIAASPKQPKQTKSGLMYFPVTTACWEPNNCSQRNGILKNTVGKYASAWQRAVWALPLSHLASHLFSFTFHLFISKVKRDGTLRMSKCASHSRTFFLALSSSGFLFAFTFPFLQFCKHSLQLTNGKMIATYFLMSSLNNLEYHKNVA